MQQANYLTLRVIIHSPNAYKSKCRISSMTYCTSAIYPEILQVARNEIRINRLKRLVDIKKRKENITKEKRAQLYALHKFHCLIT